MQNAPESVIRSWSDDRLWQTVPEDLRHGIPTAKGAGQYFVGRKGELATLAERVQQDPADVDPSAPPHERSFITTITNAPGVGKSTLLEKFAEEHHGRGGHTLQLSAHAMTSDEDLRADLDRLPAMELARWIRAILKAKEILGWLTGEGPADPTKHLAKLLVDRFGRVPAGTLHDRSSTALALKFALDNEQANPWAVMRTLSELTDGGIAVVIDEGQELGNDPSTRGAVSTTVQRLGDPTLRKDTGLRTGGLIVAGLPDTHERLTELNKSRAYGIYLRTLGESECTDLIRQGLSKGDPERRRDATIINAWAEELTRHFSGWTHHAYGAAYGAHTILHALASRSEPRLETDDPEQLLQWMQYSAARTAAALYERTISGARKMVGGDGIEDIVADANQNDGYVDRGTVGDAIRRHRKRSDAEAITEMTDHQAMERLLHVGLIGREHDSNDNVTDKIIIPIPSLQTYLSDTRERPFRQNQELESINIQPRPWPSATPEIRATDSSAEPAEPADD